MPRVHPDQLLCIPFFHYLGLGFILTEHCVLFTTPEELCRLAPLVVELRKIHRRCRWTLPF
ncbi:hypothetical protein BDW74DRAFT_144652 [Aspergillus multicolor]|uniref:uncharacterized protein n=1 Tax=Aspergillus multicolor TaxID=41759 RepID=UPI003CCD4275